MLVEIQQIVASLARWHLIFPYWAISHQSLAVRLSTMMHVVTLGSDECLIFRLMICCLIVHLLVVEQAFLVARAGEQQPTSAELFGANFTDV